MPILKVISLSTKIHSISLIESPKSSLRSAAVSFGIAKSTLHDNIPKFRRDISGYIDWQDASEER